MRTLVTIALFLISSTAWAGGNPLDAEIGRTRPLIVVAPGAGNGVAAALEGVLADPSAVSALADRQIVVFTVIGGQGAREGQPLDAGATVSVLKTVSQRADGPGAVLLIGKDGGIKLRLTTLAMEDILRAVDQMPMRQREVRSR